MQVLGSHLIELSLVLGENGIVKFLQTRRSKRTSRELKKEGELLHVNIVKINMLKILLGFLLNEEHLPLNCESKGHRGSQPRITDEKLS